MTGSVPSFSARERCLRCHKPRLTCICDKLVRVHNRTRVRVVQHPRERFHPLGTARFLELGLANVRIDVAFIERGATVGSEPARAALLYPSTDARELGELGAAERPSELVVLDGTWHHARTLRRDLAWLAALPRLKVTPRAPSRYRIRREPRFECLSTLEAVVAALGELEPETAGLAELLAAFDAMIDQQIALGRARRSTKRVKERRDPGRREPCALSRGLDRLVVVYAETQRTSEGQRELVQLAAMRLGTGALFDRVVGGALSESFRHTALDPADRARGCSSSELGRAWAEFLQPGDTIAACNQSSLDALASAGLAPTAVLLKGVYASTVARAPGTLEQVLSREALRPEPAAVRGRASWRLAAAAEIARFLHARSRA